MIIEKYREDMACALNLNLRELVRIHTQGKDRSKSLLHLDYPGIEGGRETSNSGYLSKITRGINEKLGVKRTHLTTFQFAKEGFQFQIGFGNRIEKPRKLIP